MSRIAVESAYEVLAKARVLEKQGRSVIHLEIGEPDFQTPAHVVQAGKQALDEGWTKYGPTQGFPELREVIAAYIMVDRETGAAALREEVRASGQAAQAEQQALLEIEEKLEKLALDRLSGAVATKAAAPAASQPSRARHSS